MKFKDVLKESIRFAIANTVHKPLVWLGISFLLLVYTITTITGCLSEVSENIILISVLFAVSLLSRMFLSGMMLKIFRGKYADFSHPGKCFFQGFQNTVISLIYLIIPAALLAALIRSAGQDMTYAVGVGDFSVLLNSPVTIVGIVISFILIVIIYLIYIPGHVNFARQEKFSAAFDFPVIFKMIKKLGPGKYILGLLLLIPITLLFSIALYILILAVTFIPVFTVIILNLSSEVIIGITIAISVLICVPSDVILMITLAKYLSGLFVPDEDNSEITPSEDTASINQEEASAETAERA